MKLTRRENNLLKFLGLVLFLVLFAKFIIIPLSAQLVKVQAERAIVAEKLEKAKDAVATEKELDQKIQVEWNKASKYFKKYFASSNQEELVLMLNEFTRTDLKVSKLTFDKFKKLTKGEVEFQTMGAVLTCEGTYPSTAQLLRTMWNFPKHIGIDTLEITGAGNGLINSEIGITFYWVPNAPDNNDSLVQWIADETFYKADPYTGIEGDPNRANYIFIGGDEVKLQDLFKKPFADIAGHWAAFEIEAFRQAGFVMADAQNNFKPDEPITRGEFIIMLDRLYQWPAPETPVDLTKYSDYSSLGSYEGVIAKAVYKGYLGGYVVGFTDNTLRPRDPLTYDEMAFVMSKLKNDPTFTWKLVGDKLLNERGITSIGLTDTKQPMSRAEAVYLMTYFK